jgi:hypothetical protein
MAFFSQGWSFRFQHSPGTAVLAPILRLTIAISAVFDDIFALAHATNVANRFLDHPSILFITYFCATTRSKNPTTEFLSNLLRERLNVTVGPAVLSCGKKASSVLGKK